MKQPKPKIQQKLAQAVVVLDRQAGLIDRLVERQRTVLADVEKAIASKSTTIEHVLDVYNYAFALLDHITRYLKIARSVPCLNQSKPEFRALTSGVGKITEARDQIQHVNNDIENNNLGPLLGGVCWVTDKRQYLVNLHDIGRKRSSPGIVYDTQEDRYLTDLCYTYGNTYYDLSKAIAAIRAFNDYVHGTVQIELNGKPFDRRAHFGAISMAIVRQVQNSPNKSRPSLWARIMRLVRMLFASPQERLTQ
jgi:hypothetical protein